MGAYDQTNPSTEYWIDSDDYSKLLNDHKTSAMVSSLVSANGTSQAILVSGVFDSSGSVTLDDWYILPEAELSTFSPGPYAFEYRDTADNVLYQQSFDISYTLPGQNLTKASFVYTIPYIPGTAKVIVKYNNMMQAQKIVSPNAPAVTVLSPNGGEQLSDQVTIRWTGYDGDGDQLSYSVLISADNGNTWEPLAGGITATTYVWNISRIQAGNRYMIRVLATDGMNIGEDTSNTFFAIRGKISLPIITR